MLASFPLARPRVGLGALGRLSVPYVALAIAVRMIVGTHQLLTMDWGVPGDIRFYYQMVALSDQGWYPYIHFWTEYPPLFPLLVTGLYRVLVAIGLGSAEQFAGAMTIVMWGLDLVNLVLVYRLARHANGERAARWAAAVYAGCPALVFVSSGWFDPLAVLFLLLALQALTSKRGATAGVLIGLGILTKIFPGVLLLAAPLALGWRGTGRLLIAMGGALSVVLVPLLLIRADLLLASLASLVTRGPWETLPAILTGYYAWGMQPELADRFTAASAFFGSPTPTLLTVLPECALLLAVVAAWRMLRRGCAQPRDLYLIAALGVATFLLGNKGFSPQFIAWLIPLVLLVWPNSTGLVYVALLTAHMLVYSHVVYPAMWSYYGEQQGTREYVALVVSSSVVVRTMILAAIAIHLYWPLHRFTRDMRAA